MPQFDASPLESLRAALERLQAGFTDLPAMEGAHLTEREQKILLSTAERLHDNYPYHHPFYLGQMLKPPHPLAHMAYSLAMYMNPNNHALDGGRASSAMEKEVVADIARMFGWEAHLGHLTSSGTLANLEALWVSRELAPDQVIAASSQAHYTHERLARLLKVPFVSVPVTRDGRMDMNHLERLVQRRRIATLVVTLGTTAAGAVDPLDDILELRERYGFRVHLDAAYGGYYKLVDNLKPATLAAFRHTDQADSIAIDPHKHGLQPYGCGCVLFRDTSVGRLYHHDSPYTYFTSDELHLGEISLECSRAGAAAVALWATMQAMPLTRDGSFAQGLGKGRDAALSLHDNLQKLPGFTPILQPDLDLVLWTVNAETSQSSSELAELCFKVAEEHQLYLALVRLPRVMASSCDLVWDTQTLRCLRVCLMKPEHHDRMPEICKKLKTIRDQVCD